jgi:hypothetical protein
MGSFLALYVAETAAGAMAEFFRRRPELLGFQDELRIRLFSIAFDINSECLDVRDDVGQASAGIALERLTSSDEDEGLRYAACRDLAQDAVDASVVGIAYPSAAAAWASAWNLVLFGDPAVATWTVTSFSETVIPRLRPTDVKVL